MSITATQNECMKKQPDHDVIGRKYKVLFIGPGPVPPSLDPRKNLQYHISEFCEGDFISTHWGSPSDYRGQSLSERYNTLGSFRYHATLSGGVPKPLRRSWEAAYLLWKGLQLSWSRRSFDAIIVYGAFSWAFVGWLIRCCTGAKLVILIPGPPMGGHSFHPGLMNRIKSCVAKVYVPWILRRADGLRLLFPGQIDDLPRGNYPPAFIFPDFAAVSPVPAPGRCRQGRLLCPVHGPAFRAQRGRCSHQGFPPDQRSSSRDLSQDRRLLSRPRSLPGARGGQSADRISSQSTSRKGHGLDGRLRLLRLAFTRRGSPQGDHGGDGGAEAGHLDTHSRDPLPGRRRTSRAPRRAR